MEPASLEPLPQNAGPAPTLTFLPRHFSWVHLWVHQTISGFADTKFSKENCILRCLIELSHWDRPRAASSSGSITSASTRCPVPNSMLLVTSMEDSNPSLQVRVA